jgi:hypothetical protein
MDILDDSFAALDVEALRCVLKRRFNPPVIAWP